MELEDAEPSDDGMFPDKQGGTERYTTRLTLLLLIFRLNQHDVSKLSKSRAPLP